MEHPRLFALTSKDDGQRIVAYGLALPDGTAYAVSWPASRWNTSIYSTDSAEECAAHRGAELLWINEQS